MNATKWILTAAFAALVAGPAPAAFITSLYGTGLNDDRSVRTDLQTELHYTLLSGDNTVTPIVFAEPHGFPIGPWLNDASSTTSRWITPSTATNVPAGNYTYTTTFDLTGYVASTATITGQWAADNNGLDIILNGSSLNLNNGTNTFLVFTPFTISAGSGFVAGLNTLQFVTNNDPGDGDNPAGLRVEMTGQADLVATPVPPTALLAVFAFGTAGLGRLVRRRRA